MTNLDVRNPFAKDEMRLRQLANELARAVRAASVPDIIKALGFSQEDYNMLCETRAFRQMMNEATGEWESATNTQKRIKLKAAAGLEEQLPHMLNAISSDREDLKDRIAAFVAIARVAGVGMPEPAIQADRGQYFKLEIHFAQDTDHTTPPIITGQAVEVYDPPVLASPVIDPSPPATAYLTPQSQLLQELGEVEAIV